MSPYKHPAEDVIDRIADACEVFDLQRAIPIEAVVEVLRAAVLLAKNADGSTPDEAHALDRGWGDLKRGVAHLAGRRHISEA